MFLKDGTLLEGDDTVLDDVTEYLDDIAAPEVLPR